jgi:hypothetical protein
MLTCGILIMPESVWYCRNSDNCSFNVMSNIISDLISAKLQSDWNRRTLFLMSWPQRIKRVRINNPAGDQENAYFCKGLPDFPTNRKCFLVAFILYHTFTYNACLEKMSTKSNNIERPILIFQKRHIFSDHILYPEIQVMSQSNINYIIKSHFEKCYHKEKY